MPYDFTYMWNLKTNTNEQTKENKTKIIDTENKMVFARGEWWWGEGETGEEGQEVQTSNYKINKSRGCNVQHSDCSQ